MKSLKCSDVGFPCEHVIQAETVEEVMRQAAEHARCVHQFEVTPEQAAEIQKLVSDEAHEA